MYGRDQNTLRSPDMESEDLGQDMLRSSHITTEENTRKVLGMSWAHLKSNILSYSVFHVHF